jgi:putative pyruvate formate lyase activating enzyme
MFEIVRPDVKDALKDKTVRRILPRYVKVAEDKLPANFQISKRIVVGFDKSLTTAQLWNEHEKLMKKFYEIKAVIDKKKLKIEDLEIPRFSLLDLKIFLTREIMKSCGLCERKCGINRLEGELGFCRVGNECRISSEFIHTGEESFYCPSHTIFFWSCNMNCIFCQNFTISNRLERGTTVTPQTLAKAIEKRRGEGCRNVNFVGGEGTMHLLWILEALKDCGINTPTLWNSNFFMSEKTMQLLDGIVDVYLTDFKYGPGICSEKLTKVKNYWDVVARNHLLAKKQTETTIRHLVLPDHVECCTFPVLEWVAKNMRSSCIVNLMGQYYPCYLAMEYPEINRGITKEEFRKAVNYAKKLKVNYIT